MQLLSLSKKNDNAFEHKCLLNKAFESVQERVMEFVKVFSVIKIYKVSYEKIKISRRPFSMVREKKRVCDEIVNGR